MTYLNWEERDGIPLANSPFFWVALIAGLLGLYILPSLIGVIRRVEGLGWLSSST